MKRKPMRPGLASVTFRHLEPREIIRLCLKNSLQCLEWGGDVHVPPRQLRRAREVAELTADAGLSTICYGSYYRLGGVTAEFEPILEAAVALQAPSIRVWAGDQGSGECDPRERDRIIHDALRVAELASQAGVPICYELHAHTQMDETAASVAFLRATRHPAIFSLWQPLDDYPFLERLENLDALLHAVRHVHVFHRLPGEAGRLPLSEGWSDWLAYLHVLRNLPEGPDLLLEFLPAADQETLSQEAETLRALIAQVENEERHSSALAAV